MPSYYTYEKDVPLLRGQTVGFVPGKGYYARGQPGPVSERAPGQAPARGHARLAAVQPGSAAVVGGGGVPPRSAARMAAAQPRPAETAPYRRRAVRVIPRAAPAVPVASAAPLGRVDPAVLASLGFAEHPLAVALRERLERELEVVRGRRRVVVAARVLPRRGRLGRHAVGAGAPSKNTLVPGLGGFSVGFSEAHRRRIPMGEWTVEVRTEASASIDGSLGSGSRLRVSFPAVTRRSTSAPLRTRVRERAGSLTITKPGFSLTDDDLASLLSPDRFADPRSLAGLELEVAHAHELAGYKTAEIPLGSDHYVTVRFGGKQERIRVSAAELSLKTSTSWVGAGPELGIEADLTVSLRIPFPGGTAATVTYGIAASADIEFHPGPTPEWKRVTRLVGIGVAVLLFGLVLVRVPELDLPGSSVSA